MSDATAHRPRQATLAGWLIIVGSVLLVISVFQRVSGLHTLETREAVERFLAEPPGAQLGIDVDRALTLLHTMSLIAGGCATAMAILGYQALQRSKLARLLLTVLAAPVFVTGLVSGGFLSSLVAAAAAMLWFQPTRDWFDGVRHQPPADRGADRAADRGPDPWAVPPPDQSPPARSGVDGDGGPRPVSGFGAPAGQPTTQLLEQQQQRPPGRSPRPGAVTWACALTWTFCGLVAAMMLLSVVALAAAPDLVFDELRRQQPELSEDLPSQSALQQASYLAGAVTVAWCVAASALAAFVYRGAGWARTALIVSAAVAALVCLVGSLQSVLLVVPLFACLATVVLLLRPEVRAWYSGRGTLRP